LRGDDHVTLLHMAGLENSECNWGEVGKGKRVDVYLEVRKRRGHIFFEWNKCPWSNRWAEKTFSHFHVKLEAQWALPHFASIFFAYLWSFRWPNYIVTLPRYFSFRLPHLNISIGHPSDELDKNSQRTWLIKILSQWNGSATSGLHWIFHMHSEFSRPAMCNNVTWSSPFDHGHLFHSKKICPLLFLTSR
jgi:hypothetical protein